MEKDLPQNLNELKKELKETRELTSFHSAKDSISQASLNALNRATKISETIQSINLVLDISIQFAEHSSSLMLLNSSQVKDYLKTLKNYRESVRPLSMSHNDYVGLFESIETYASQLMQAWRNYASSFLPEQIAELLRGVAQVNELKKTLATEIVIKTVEAHSTIYEKEASKHQCAARTAGVFSLLVLFLTVSLAGYFLNNTSETEVSLAKLGPRVAIFAGLFYGISALFRITRSNYHLEAVYRQRHLACKSYEPLIKAVDDPESKKQITKDMTACLFSSVPTGYIPTEKDEGAEKIVNMIVPQKS